MKNPLRIGALLFITAVVFIGLACQPPRNEPDEHMDSDEHYDEGIPLIYQMSFMQRYAAKLYLSGMEENWGLADIYAHEMEEITEVMIDGMYMDDGVNISELMESMFPPQLEQVEAAIDAKDKARFEEAYQTMIQTCNKCHESAEYGLVKITVPDSNPFAQDFSAPAEE